MASGGARARSGPAKDPNSVNGAKGDWVALPAIGRSGRIPRWPLPAELSAWGKSEWRRLWRLPQAIEWERLKMHTQVAVYAQVLDEITAGDTRPQKLANLQRMETSLGISVAGMHANGWRIARGIEADVPAKPQSKSVAKVTDIRDRYGS